MTTLGLQDLQGTYDASISSPQIVVTAALGSVTIADAAVTIGNVVELTTNGGTVFLAAAEQALELGLSTRRHLVVDYGVAGGRGGIRHLPDDYTQTVSPSVTYALQWDSTVTTNVSGGGGLGNDTAPAMVGAVGTCIFADQGNVFSSALLFNQGTTIQCQANVGPIYTMVNQPVILADGGSFSCSQHNALRIQPKWGPNLNAGSITQGSAVFILNVATVDATVGSAAVTTMIYWQANNPTLTAGGTIGTFVALDVANITGPGSITGLRSAMSSGTFISHTGTAPSSFNGSVTITNSANLVVGDVTGVALDRSGASTLRFAATENLTLALGTINNAILSTTTGAGLRLSFDAISFGTTDANPSNANWFTIFSAPNLRSPSAAGQYADVLWTAGGAVDVNGLAITDLSAFQIDSVATILSGGSIADSSTLFVNAMASANATRLQALRVLGRTRLDGLLTHNEATLAQLTADVAALALPANNAGRFVLLMDADALGPWTVQGIVNVQPGDAVYLINNGANAWDFSNEDAAAAAADRIITPNAGTWTLAANRFAKLWYDPVATRWRILESNGA